MILALSNSRWRRVLLWCALCGLLCAGAARGANISGQFSDELTTDHYDCLLSLQPEATLPITHTVTLALETGAGIPDVQCVISRATLRLFAGTNGKRRKIGEMASHVVPGTAYDLTIFRRGSALALYHDHAFLFRGTVPPGTGTKATITAEAGWSVTAARIQRLEPVAFADDFMRSDGDPKAAQGAWTVQSGQWALQSTWDNLPQGNGNKFSSTIYAENPFAWIGTTQSGAAICTTGAAEWEDYTYNVAVNPDAHGAVGVLANLTDAHNGLLVRWSPANDHGPAGNALVVYRLLNDKRTLLATSPGGFVPGQWYRMTVISSLQGVRVSIDDQPRITLDGGEFWRGGVGLYTEGKDGSVFDDVTVYGQTLDTDLLREMHQSHITQKFLDDRNGMKEWAVNPEIWQPEPSTPGLCWYPDTIHGDHNWEYLTVNPTAHATGSLTLILHGDHTAPLASGYRAVIAIAGTPPRLNYKLFRGTVTLADNSVDPLTPDTDYSIRFKHIGTQISLEVDDTPVVQVTDPQPLNDGLAGYQLQGQAFQRLSDIHAMSRNMLDYTFAEEPADWRAVGTWMPSVRWACTPTWSFLGGWSRGDAVLWHKAAFTGDQSLEAFLGVQMEFPREREDYFNLRYPGYFAVTLCGDGQDPRNGYCAIFGEPTDGAPNARRMVLLRNGVEEGSAPITPHGWWENHHEWFGLRLEKQGNTITFRVTRGPDKYALTFNDAQPLAGGIPAVWTRNNAVSLARARINCANIPTPRNDPKVVIDTPWYPEWANIGQPETLHFTDCWSTTGLPVSLRVIPRDVPPADKTAVIANKMDVRFAPTTAGDHWYQVVASDGVHTSQAFHLDQTVFNPALGRDDSHALVLYRFDEGNGGTVHDRSKVTPPLDLAVPAPLDNAQWLPGQGLLLHGHSPLTTVGATDKLLAIAKTKACTIEFWISTETIFYPYPLLAWEQSATARNLRIDHSMNNLHLDTHAFTENDQDGSFPRLRTSLQHYVFTWDGTTTRCYCNGDLAGQKVIPWAPEQWQGSYPLTLGTNWLTYLGTFYLFAIHDRCFTQEEIQRHYQAGPSAR